jgi:hypothetical protein
MHAGGPPAKELSNETEKIVDMMKDCSSFVVSRDVNPQ